MYDPSIGLNERGIIPARETIEFALGVDLGRQADFTAISLIEKHVRPVPLDHPHAVDSTLRQRVFPPRFTIRHLERRALGEDYIQQAQRVAQIVTNPQIRGRCELVVDKTGVGVAVVDIFRRDFGLDLVGVTITGGSSETQDPDPRCPQDWRVPKINLVSVLQAAFNRGDLKVAKDIAERDTLAKELGDFQVKLTDAGTVTTGARSGSHDDLVLSVAIALWRLTRTGNRVARQTVFV
jgi:hypothetical protein